MEIITEHRKAWIPYLNKERIFRGQVERFGHKHRQGSKIKRGATLVIKDVHLKSSPLKIDHAWIDYTPNLAVYGAEICPGSKIEFTAMVSAYTKGGKNAVRLNVDTFEDLELTNIKNVKVLSHPRMKKDALIGNKLVSYAIGTRTNTKTGKLLGVDPQRKLGKIYVGQTFANKLARRLSYEYSK